MFTVDYDYYKNTYGGSLASEKIFNLIIDRAIGIANSYLTVDLYEIDASDLPDTVAERLRKALCASVDCLNTCLVPGTNAVSRELSGESVSGMWSKSYASSGDGSDADMHNGVYSILNDYLSGTALLCRGYYVHG